MKSVSAPILVLYVPALHQGYIKLFEKYPKAQLYILDTDVIAEFPLTAREIRSLTPEQAKGLIESAGYFAKVSLANKETLAKLKADPGQQVILSTEQISDWLAENYFSHHQIIREPVFLRYDEKISHKVRLEQHFKGKTTTAKNHRKLMSEAINEAGKSTDLFLQVGALLNTQIGTIIHSHNLRMPAPHEMSSVGDPRNFLAYSSDSHLRTTLHAEQALIAQCAREGVKTEGADLYITTFPCPDCGNIIAEAGIKRVYFKDGYSQLSSLDTIKAYDIEIIRVTQSGQNEP